MKNLILENDSATKKLGQKISEIIKSSDKQNIEIHLQGDLGAGKTFMTRSIINNCGWEDLVKSPTYTLCEEYDLDEFLFLHIDLYRTNEAQDIDIFNLEIMQPVAMETELNQITGVVTNGLFAKRRANQLFIGTTSGVKIIKS